MWITCWDFSNVFKVIIVGMTCVCPLISTWNVPLKNDGNEEPDSAQDRFFFKYTSPWWGLPKFDISKEAKKSWKLEDGYFGRPTWGPHKFPGVYSVTVINPQFMGNSTANPPTTTTTVSPPTTTAKTVTVIVKYKRLRTTPKPSDEEDDCSVDHYDGHDSGYETEGRKPRGRRGRSQKRRRSRKRDTRRSLPYSVVPYFIPAFYF